MSESKYIKIEPSAKQKTSEEIIWGMVKNLEERTKTLEEIIEEQKRITDKIITGKLNMAKPPNCNVCGSPRIGLSTSGEWGVKKCMACGAFGAFVFPGC